MEFNGKIKPRIPIISFKDGKAPIIICVKMVSRTTCIGSIHFNGICVMKCLPISTFLSARSAIGTYAKTVLNDDKHIS